MLTNLDWLAPGREYPPKAEQDRIDRYKLHEQLFLSRHPEAWQDLFADLAAKLHKRYRDSAVDTVLNYHQLLSKKTADFVCGEPPTIESEGNTDALARLLNHQRFPAQLYEAIIDVSRYGNAVPKIVGKRLTMASPMYWYPVVDPTDVKTITHQVIAYPIEPDADGNPTKLYAEIHTPGIVETRYYQYDATGAKIGQQIDEPRREVTGLQDFAVQPLTNITHTGSVYGLDDYGIVNSLVAKVMWRLHCADNVLDKHSAPSMSGPASALSYDDRTGLYYLDLGNYFKRNGREDPEPQYITWDGNLDANWREIEILLNQLYILTEMGQAFAEGGGGGGADSGTALKLRMVSPRIKAARLAGINAPTIKRIVAMLAQVNGIPLDYDTITVTWHDGLPNDDVEQTNTLITATGGKAIMSQYSALKARGLTDAEVEAEMQQLRDEQATSVPFALSTQEVIEATGEDDVDGEA